MLINYDKRLICNRKLRSHQLSPVLDVSTCNAETNTAVSKLPFGQQTLHDIQGGKVELAPIETQTSSHLHQGPQPSTLKSARESQAVKYVTLIPTATSNIPSNTNNGISDCPNLLTATSHSSRLVTIGKNKVVLVAGPTDQIQSIGQSNQTKKVSPSIHIAMANPQCSTKTSPQVGKENQSLLQASQPYRIQPKQPFANQPTSSTVKEVLTSSQSTVSIQSDRHSSVSIKGKGKMKRQLSRSQKNSPSNSPAPEVTQIKTEPPDTGYFASRIKRAKYRK